MAYFLYWKYTRNIPVYFPSIIFTTETRRGIILRKVDIKTKQISTRKCTSECNMMNLHKACRNQAYFVPSGEKVERLTVPDDKVPWSVPWTSYNPPSFTLKSLSKQPWADPELGPDFNPKWNALDDGVNRQSHMGPYEVRDGCPLNPCGRTGLQGRGRLGRWGPNHAVDSIVTRWKRDSDGEGVVVNPSSKKPILQFVSIQRRDTGEWALPGGMVDCGESADDAVRREFLEEALNTPKVSDFFATEKGKRLKDFFYCGTELYKGYVDDPRNTDNAWMETVAFHFHDEQGSTVALMKIEAGDDAAKAQWVDLSSSLRLYASHSKILRLVALKLETDW